MAYDTLLFWQGMPICFPYLHVWRGDSLLLPPLRVMLKKFSQLWAEYVHHYAPD
jgi:hypothetical protein